MLSRLYHYLFPWRAQKKALTVEELNRMDVAVEEDVFDCEKVMIENGEVVGETAILNERDELESTGGPLPTGYDIHWSAVLIFTIESVNQLSSKIGRL